VFSTEQLNVQHLFTIYILKSVFCAVGLIGAFVSVNELSETTQKSKSLFGEKSGYV